MARISNGQASKIQGKCYDTWRSNLKFKGRTLVNRGFFEADLSFKVTSVTTWHHEVSNSIQLPCGGSTMATTYLNESAITLHPYFGGNEGKK